MGAQSLPPPPPPPLPPPPPTPSPPPPSSTPRLPGHSIATEHGGCADAASQPPGAGAATTGGDLARAVHSSRGEDLRDNAKAGRLPRARCTHQAAMTAAGTAFFFNFYV
ncbi:amyloid beta A4 precursor protein-binding family B member 1-interacting protein-like [Bos indicus]|uniref:Amyloid beta A4 precursor protein-binding family B member 1-interacting protein-like n=1 Tax=Bos indicus TaxID=9915 RepID=A0ABM4QP71_BOSIN